MRKLMLIFTFFSLAAASSLASSFEFKNPYLNKNIDTHFKEFVVFEILAEFQKAIETYNQSRGDLPAIEEVADHYQIKDKKNNILSFTIDLALKGDFYYNGKLTNIKSLKNPVVPKTVLNFLIHDASADEVMMSDILLAALWKMDNSFSWIKEVVSFGSANIKIITTKINEYQRTCNALLSEGDVLIKDKKKERDLLDKLFKQMIANKNNEAEIVKKTFGVNNPNCMMAKSDNSSIKQYGTGLRDSTLEATSGARYNRELCIALETLKECLVGVYDLNINSSARGYFKEKDSTPADDLKQYQDGSVSR